MILIADSGSTKTDWRLINGGKISQHVTEGLNPVYKSVDYIQKILEIDLVEIDAKQVKEVHFYGAGCMNFERGEAMAAVLENVFSHASISVNSDILAAARATADTKEAIVAILGTGANVCHYNGKEIVSTRSGLGYVLGDEGSGAIIGKEFIKAILNKELPSDIEERFFEKFKLTKRDIIDATYRKDNPNLFFASFSRYVFQIKNKEGINDLIIGCFEDFFKKHILVLDNHKDVPLHLVGSVAFYYGDYIRRIASKYKVNVGTILEKPIAGLALHHLPNP